jgi:hypothetical protein
MCEKKRDPYPKQLDPTPPVGCIADLLGPEFARKGIRCPCPKCSAPGLPPTAEQKPMPISGKDAAAGEKIE